MHIRGEIPKGAENMRRMLVMGNGFDVAHGIPSKYYNFHQWLKEEDEDFIEKMSIYFPDAMDESLEWWNDFENNLDKVDAQEEIQRIVEENYPNFASDDFRDGDYHAASIEIEEEMKNLYNEIQVKFETWIKTIDLNRNGIHKFNLLNFDFFLTFNYTNTLQEIYGIHPSKILYIHGQANVSEKLILGHNADPNHYKPGIDAMIPEPPDNLDPMELQEWYEENSEDYIATSTRQAAEAMVRSFRKPTEEIIDKYRVFFALINKLEEISFYGFSFAPVDLPYVEKIAFFTNDSAVWKIYYYSQEDLKCAEFIKRKLSKSHKFLIEIIHADHFPNYDSIQPTLPGII